LRVSAPEATRDLDSAILLGLARQLGREMVVRPGDEGVQALAAGRADIVTGVRLGGGPDPQGFGSVEILPTRFVAVTYRNQEPVLRIEDLRGKVLWMVRGGGADRVAADSKVTQGGLEQVDSAQSVLEALREGRATVGILAVEEVLCGRNRDGALQSGVFLGPRYRLVYAVRDATLQRSLDAYLRGLRTTAAWNVILDRNLGSGYLEMLRRARLLD
jgi:ABC-type amino acid transport substrate-binding protein